MKSGHFVALRNRSSTSYTLNKFQPPIHTKDVKQFHSITQHFRIPFHLKAFRFQVSVYMKRRSFCVRTCNFVLLWKINFVFTLRYILSLALADLLVIITSVPFTSVIYTLESWPWGELICKLSETAKDISIGVSVFTLTALSADRFFAIVDPLKKFHTTGEWVLEQLIGLMRF